MIRSTRYARGGRGAVGVVAVAALAGCGGVSPGAQLGLEERFHRWAAYEGDATGSSFSSLEQINRSNVTQLEVAWTYEIGDQSVYPFNPIVIDTVLYALGRESSVIALHAATGREIWRNPLPGVPSDITSRGIMYWESPDRSERRLFTSKGQYLHAIDALTGETVRSFGTDGKVDLREGLGRDPRTVARIQSRSPGRVFENLIILGSAPGEDYDAAPGHIRAYDVRTGELVWRFNTIPYPGEYGYDTWPEDAYTRVGGVNVWGGMSVDEERGIVYLPIASTNYDFYGGNRPGQGLFATSLVALNARTGERLWHFQTVHNDLWDMDLTATPILLTVRHEGRVKDVVAQATKLGFLFVFDRVTGESLWPIEERPVPPSDMPGEHAWPTQPHPRWPEPFAIQSFTLDDVNPYLPPEEQAEIRARLSQILNLDETLYQPPSLRETMQMPGNAGGANWGSTAGDPQDGSFYVITKNLPTVLKLEPILPGTFGTGTSSVNRGLFVYTQNCSICHQSNLQGTPPLIPSLDGVTNRLTVEQIRTIIQEGSGTMPAFRDLTDQDINGLITYLTTPGAARPELLVQNGEQTQPTRYQTGYGYYAVSGGMYARKPPFTTMTKYDLNTGAIQWQVPVGEVQSLVERGITDNTGAANFRGGPAVTAGGLIFVSTGETLRAYDSDTGEQLWRHQLPRESEGIPAVYEVGGRQYVVVSVTAGSPSDPRPRSYVAFALPEHLIRR